MRIKSSTVILGATLSVTLFLLHDAGSQVKVNMSQQNWHLLVNARDGN